MRERLRSYAPQITLLIGTALISWACAGSNDGDEGDEAATTLTSIIASEPTSPDTTPPTAAATTTSTASSTRTDATTTSMPPVEPLAIDETSFVALSHMTPVRGFFVDNVLGDISATVEVAESPDGGTYPMGSLVQLVPGEAMVKREPGFSPTTNDWEFFELDVDESGSTIRVRGGDEVVNRFGGSCAACHALAEPQWDLICEQDHGCDPLPFDRATIEAIQAADPRP